MVAEGHKVAQLSGALEGNERDRIIDQFRSGQAKVLITTNVLARGIDVQSVTMVINYVRPACYLGLAYTNTLRMSRRWQTVGQQTQRPISIASVVPAALDV